MIRRLFALGLAFALTVIALGSAQSMFAGDGGGTPLHNAPSVSWYQGVPAYSTITTSKMTTILNGRGYVY